MFDRFIIYWFIKKLTKQSHEKSLFFTSKGGEGFKPRNYLGSPVGYTVVVTEILGLLSKKQRSKGQLEISKGISNFNLNLAS